MQNTLHHNLSDLKKSSGKIVITTHHKPDGDAMGSSLALFNYFKNAGIASLVITPTDYSDALHWLPGDKDVLIFEGNEGESARHISKANYVFCLDFNALGRINTMGELVGKSDAKKILIDHHENPEDFDNERLWDAKFSSTCELVYNYLTEQLDQQFMNADIAQCIYTGMVTDTGSFRYSNTSSNTMRTASALLDLGAKPTIIYDKIFENKRLEQLQLLGFFLNERIEIIENGKVALCHLTQQDLERYNVITGDTEGFVNYGLSITGIIMSALIIDRGPLVKMSFRSKGLFPCNEFSAEFFGGGGHKNAAGGASRESLASTLAKFKEAIKTYDTYI